MKEKIANKLAKLLNVDQIWAMKDYLHRFGEEMGINRKEPTKLLGNEINICGKLESNTGNSRYTCWVAARIRRDIDSGLCNMEYSEIPVFMKAVIESLQDDGFKINYYRKNSSTGEIKIVIYKELENGLKNVVELW